MPLASSPCRTAAGGRDGIREALAAEYQRLMQLDGEPGRSSP
jgi:hypothetical protein